VVNKFSQSWATINDPLDNTYQGYHYYFNSWSVSYAISNAKLALSKGIKLINTEVGADYREHGYYTTYTVDELDSFLSQCESLGVSNLVWMNEDLNNWSSYQYYELTFPGAPLAESSTLYQVNLQSEKEDNATSNLGSIVFGGTNYSLPGLVSMELGDCSLTYSPSSGYVFDHWVLNGSAAIADSKSQSTTVSVSGNCTVKATYTQVADQHILHVEVRGTGTTNATGDTSYIEGTVVSVNASASSGWTLSHWLLDNLNVGSANPYSVAVDNDRNLTAVFMQVPFTYLFSDGFESNSFSSWSSTTTTSGDSVKTSNTHPYGGSFEAQFYTTGNTKSRENACLRKNVNLQSINASGFFSFSSSAGRSLLSDNGDKLYLIRLSSSKGDIALAGIIRENGVYKWLLYTNGAVTSSAIPIATDQYYSVALRWNSVQRTAEMYVNGVRTLGRITNTYSVVSRVDMGIINTFSIQYPLWVYGDNFTITN
jgi:hypothetical protein